MRELSEQETRELIDAFQIWNDAAEVSSTTAVRLSSKGWRVQQRQGTVIVFGATTVRFSSFRGMSMGSTPSRLSPGPGSL